MTLPLAILAVFAVVLGFINTPAWPWFTSFLEGPSAAVSTNAPRASWNPALDFGRFAEAGLLPLMLLSSLIVLAGTRASAGGSTDASPSPAPTDPDPLEQLAPPIFRALQHRFYVDELYEWTIILAARRAAHFSAWLDRWVWNGAVSAVRLLVTGLGWVDASLDKHAVNAGFDEGCRGVVGGGRLFSRFQNGRVQNYLRVIAAALVVLAALLLWRSAA